ncbi:MAG: hypothetical protein HYU63_05680 [Armatimonadetes bacterium]|nr:hypothetical protein [Armatimonadota bacterium]
MKKFFAILILIGFVFTCYGMVCAQVPVPHHAKSAVKALHTTKTIRTKVEKNMIKKVEKKPEMKMKKMEKKAEMKTEKKVEKKTEKKAEKKEKGK